jgi:hypothetical protein
MYETIQRFLNIGAPVAISLGVIIALLQFRNQQHLRQLEIVMRLYSTFGEENFVRHFLKVSSWQYRTYEDYRRKNDPEDYVSLMVVSVFFENMGLLLKRKWVPIELLDDLLSGPLLDVWPKVKPIWDGMRKEYEQPSWAEWFEYFHDAMALRMTQLNGRGYSVIQAD